MGRSRRDQTNDTDDLRRTVEQRREALRTVNELRSPLWDAITAELDRGKSKGSFSRRATTVGKRMQKGFDDFNAGKVTRARAIKSYERGLAQLREDYEKRSVDALWDHATLHPSTAEVIAAWLNRRVDDQAQPVQIDKYLGWLFEHYRERPSDVGVIEQGLGDPAPPPLGTCASPPYAFRDDRVFSQAISVGNFAISTPSSGRAMVDVMGDLAGGASGHSLVGADFAVPAGYTNIAVTANIDWTSAGGASPLAAPLERAPTSCCGSRTPQARPPYKQR